MAAAALKTIVNYCDRILGTSAVRDYDGAVNGLQFENNGRITRLAAAVDARLATIRMAVEAGADLLLVHHGLFWGQPQPWTGRRRELLELLVKHNLAVYSSHLPLDMHPRLGNNARLCDELGLRKRQPFFQEHNQCLGFMATVRLDRHELQKRLATVLGRQPLLIPFGPKICRRIGVVTGGAGNHLRQAALEGVDTFVTGEGAHWTHALAEELGLNVFYGGHYATETFGVKALAAHLSRRFKLPWDFLDFPTEL